VRLFVQACVLSGCDYAPNLLTGVGLVTAFKCVKENSIFLPEDVFASVLRSLRKNVPKTVDAQQYKETLSKSEAVFYYHYVKNKNGNIVHLISNRVGTEYYSRQHKYVPKLDAFKGDLSFLGTTTEFSKNQTTKGDHNMLVSRVPVLLNNKNVTNTGQRNLMNSFFKPNSHLPKAATSPAETVRATMDDTQTKENNPQQLQPAGRHTNSLMRFALVDPKKRQQQDVRMGKHKALCKTTLEPLRSDLRDSLMEPSPKRASLSRPGEASQKKINQPTSHAGHLASPDWSDTGSIDSPGAESDKAVVPPWKNLTGNPGGFGVRQRAPNNQINTFPSLGKGNVQHQSRNSKPMQNPYLKSRATKIHQPIRSSNHGRQSGTANANEAVQTSGFTTSPFFCGKPRSKQTTRRVTLEELPGVPKTGPTNGVPPSGSGCIDLTDNDEIEDLAPMAPPAFDYSPNVSSKGDRHKKRAAKKPESTPLSQASWSCSDVDSPDSSCKSIDSEMAIKPTRVPPTKKPLPKFQRHKRIAPPKGEALVASFKCQEELYHKTEDTPDSLGAVVKKTFNRMAERKKQKTIDQHFRPRLTVQVHEREKKYNDGVWPSP